MHYRKTGGNTRGAEASVRSPRNITDCCLKHVLTETQITQQMNIFKRANNQYGTKAAQVNDDDMQRF